MFNKLDFINPNIYRINKKKEFVPVLNVNGYISQIFDFSYAMTFAATGHHRNHRSGGDIRRDNVVLFVNVFQGKIAEYALYKKLINAGINVNEPDISIMGKGVWDDTDFCYKNYKISVKSAAHFSNLLLLEKKDWNSSAEYIPNLNSANAKYDFFVFCRVKPDVKSFVNEIYKYVNEEGNIDKIKLKMLMINGNSWLVDIPGCISHNNLLSIIKTEYCIPKNALLNGKIKMDATNYYIQSGDMRSIEKLISFLKALP